MAGQEEQARRPGARLPRSLIAEARGRDATAAERPWVEKGRVAMNTAFDRGEVIGQRDLLDRFSYDCLWRAEAHGKRGVSACGVYLPDLDRDRSKCLIRPRTGLQIARHGAGSWQVLASDRATTPVAISLTPGVYASSCFVTIGTYPASRPLGGVTMSFGSTFTKFMTLGGFAM